LECGVMNLLGGRSVDLGEFDEPGFSVDDSENVALPLGTNDQIAFEMTRFGSLVCGCGSFLDRGSGKGFRPPRSGKPFFPPLAGVSQVLPEFAALKAITIDVAVDGFDT